ncbi:MAG: ABC transporter substrate-binding protein [Dehalococcoidia bacterium]|nr:ABC transporter substrate-binding protein [Dehalococcoidia bacterium]
MKRSVVSIYRWSLRVTIIAAALSLWLACGQAEAPTPTVAPAATATPTKAVVATATPTRVAPVATATPMPTTVGPVATPTPTLVATPTSAAQATEKPRYGGTEQYVMNTYAEHYDFQGTASGNDRPYTLGKLYNSLLINYEGKNVECEVCSEWHLANSGKTMVFTLIPGIKFHNGQEMTSEDVKYSLRMLIGEVDGIVSARAGSLKEFVQSIEAPSRYEVRLNLTIPSGYVPKIMAVGNNVIYPAGTTRDDLKKAPAGSGPYLLVKAVPGASFEMEKNPNYFKPGLPYIDNIRMALVADTNTRVAAFLTHRVEFVGGPTAQPAQFLPQFNKLKDEGKINSYNYLIGSRLEGVFMALTKPPFNNLKLRQAVNLALDRRAYGNAILVGEYRAAVLVFREADGEYGRPDSQIWDVVPGWGVGAKKQQEIEQAKQLVIDAGYPNGLDITWMAYASSSTGNAQELFQQQLNKVGLRTTIEMVTTQDLFNARQLKQDYQISIFPFVLTTAAPEEVVGAYWVTGSVRNPTGYGNPEVDKLFIQMSAETDPAKKVALFKQIEQIIVFKDQGWAPMPSDVLEVFWWKRLQGVGWGMATHPTASSGLLRGDRLWFKD